MKSLGLVLCRREGERIFIGPDIVVEVVETFSTKVRLAISAPEDVLILREELAERVRAGPPAGLREDDLDHR